MDRHVIAGSVILAIIINVILIGIIIIGAILFGQGIKQEGIILVLLGSGFMCLEIITLSTWSCVNLVCRLCRQ